VILGYAIIAVVLVGGFGSGYIVMGPGTAQKTEVKSPFLIFPLAQDSNLRTLPLIPYYNAHTTGATSISQDFQLNSTMIVTGGIVSTNGVDVFIFPTDAEGLFTGSLQASLANATGYTYTTGAVVAVNISVTLPEGAWTVFFIDPASVNTTVTLTQSIVANSLVDFHVGG